LALQCKGSRAAKKAKSHVPWAEEKIASAPKGKTDFAAIAFPRPIHDIRDQMVEHMTEPATFDPFGEEVTMTERTAPVRGSRWLMRAGAGLFWTLVIVIVAARAIYFQPGIFNGFERALAFAQNLFAAL
jgi:hypothetical protein